LPLPPLECAYSHARLAAACLLPTSHPSPRVNHQHRRTPALLRARSNLGLFDRAVEDYSRAIELDGTNAAAFNNRCVRGRARAYEVQRRSGASWACRLTSERPSHLPITHPPTPIPLPCSGYAWRKLGRYDAAIADYSRSLELEPDNIKTLNNRGYSYAKSGLYDAAVADYSRVIALDGGNAHAFHNRGISYDKKGLYEAAIAGERRGSGVRPRECGGVARTPSRSHRTPRLPG
jgi:tetratricopeptide (TPR) repeat protein